jgi:hypothetical protein
MAAPKKPGHVRHLHIDPYVRVKHENPSASFVNDKRVDRFLIWWDGLPSRQRTKMALELLIAACNGELGVAPGVVMDGDESAENKSALDELLKNMVMDEE